MKDRSLVWLTTGIVAWSLPTLAAGDHLRQAKLAVPHGGWEKWVKEEVGISPATARMLMIIAQHPALANRYYSNDLPPSWRTLYELSQLDAPLLEAAIQSGAVHPQLEGKQAKALVIKYKMLAAEVSFDLRHGDFQSVLGDIEPGTVDAIITDPPYPAEFLPLYAKLAEHAAQWLKPSDHQPSLPKPARGNVAPATRTAGRGRAGVRRKRAPTPPPPFPPSSHL